MPKYAPLVMYSQGFFYKVECLFPSQLKPPLEPPSGEVNAADAFDIGSFDEDDIKKIKVSVQAVNNSPVYPKCYTVDYCFLHNCLPAYVSGVCTVVVS